MILTSGKTEAEVSMAKDAGLKLFDYAELTEIGKQNEIAFAEVKPSDIYTFCYTSGTTGDAKGAIISHKNILASMTAILHTYPNP